MKLQKKTVKELQEMCRQANLPTTGVKAVLIERLEFQSANNTLSADLTARVRELEDTILRLETRAANGNCDVNNDRMSIGRASTPQPKITDDQLQQDIPVSEPQYMPIGVSQYEPVSAPQTTPVTAVHFTPVSAPQYTPVNATNYVPGSVPQYTPVTTAQYVPVSKLPYAPLSVPPYASAGAPHYLPLRAIPYAPVSVQQFAPTYAPVGAPQYVTASIPQRTFATSTQQYVQGPTVNSISVQPPMLGVAPAPTVTATMTLKDIISVLPDFDPTAANSLSSMQFVQRVQTLKSVYQWRDDILVFAAQQKLRGHAKYWMDSQAEVFVTWANFANRLMETFPSNLNAADAHIKMANTKRGTSESPQEFYYKMLALGNKHGLTEDAISRHIINGINEPDLRRKISNEYATCIELLRDIESYCRFNDCKSTFNKNDQSHPQVGQNNNKQVSEKKSYVQSNVRSTDNQQGRHIRCYNCNKYGHISTKCTEPQKIPRCSSCNKHHLPTAVCTANVRKIHEQKIIKKPELIKKVKINEWTGEALVDSGSDRTLMRKSVMESLGAAEECHIELNGFGGGKFICTKSKQVNMLIDGILHEVTALAVDDKYLDVDALLGRDAICQQNTRVVIENNKCWVEGIKAVTSCEPQLQENDREKLMAILAENRDCFAENLHELGTCTVKKMEIKLTTDVPVCVKPYRIAFAKREEARKIIDDLLSANIIEHSDSAYASPVVLVPKKDGSLRMCVDFRLLNRITVKTPFPMPIMEEQFAQLAGNRYFTTMDLRMGYHQIEIEKESRKYTGFVTVEGHYQYTRMPFGLVNAPAVFQNIMNTVAAKLPAGEVITYLDDVVIPSKSTEEGLTRLQKFLNVLKEVGLTLRLDKCKFLSTEISYLGHTITAEGITPGNQKVSAIRNFNTPISVTDVRRFLGLTGFFRKFIPNYAVISSPLTKMLHKAEANRFSWGDEQTASFNKLIEMLCAKPILVLYDFRAYHEVHTDASSLGLAGVLLQSEDSTNWHVVAYYSRHCTDAESRYHSYELEVLAVVETLTRFRVYLLGKSFKLVTDCSAIAKARDQKELIPKIARWYLRLMEFDFVAVHRAGAKLAHVDALSRAPNEPACEVKTAGFIHRVFIDQEDWLYTMQLQDDRLKHIISVLQGDIKDEQESQYKKEYQLIKSRLYRCDDGRKFVVPKAVRWRVVKACHDDAGHFGIDKTMARIKQTFWFPKIRKYVKQYIASCVECCYAKAQGGKPEGQMYIGEVEPRPFSTLHLDHLGPFIKSNRGMAYVLVISDAFSKMIVVKPVRSTKTGPVLAALLEITSYFGLPKRLITDRGTAFTAKAFAEFCDVNCIQHIKTAVRTPRANGQVERANSLILNSLRTTTGRPKDWDLTLREIQWTVNSQRNATTGYSPNELIFDFNLRDLTHNKMIAVLHDEENENDQQPISLKRQQASENIQQERERWKQRFDERHSTPTVYDVNDLVLVAHEPQATGESRKLEPKYKGPYIIAKALGNDRYLVKDVPGLQITQKPFESIFATDKLKKWCYSSPELDGDNDNNSDDEEGNDEVAIDSTNIET